MTWWIQCASLGWSASEPHTLGKKKNLFCLSHCDFHPFVSSSQKPFLTETNVDKLGIEEERKD